MRVLALVSTLLLSVPTTAAATGDPESAPFPEFAGERRPGWSRYFGLPGFDYDVWALEVFEDRLHIGGRFDRLDSRMISRFAIWNGETITDPGGPGGSVYAMTEHDGNLILGGDFVAFVAGGRTESVALWNGFALEAMGGGFWGTAWDLVSWNGFVVATGVIPENRWTGQWFRNVAYYGGGVWRPLGSLGLRTYHRLAVHHGELFAYDEDSVKRWVNPSHWEVAFVSSGEIAAALSWDGDLLVGGQFDAIEGMPARNLARWDGKTWSEFGGGADGRVSVLRDLGDGRLFAGGRFGRIGGVDAQSVAVWDGATWDGLGSGIPPFHNFLGAPQDAALYQGDLFVGGQFRQAGDDHDARYLARWTGEKWDALSHEGQGIESRVYSLARHERNLYAGGTFSRAGGTPASNVARFDGNEWRPLGNGLGGRVVALAGHGGGIAAAGEFDGRVSLWTGADWTPIGQGLDDRVRTVASYAGGLFAGGDFSGHLARWDGAAWQPVAGGTDGPVHALLARAGRLYVGGGFGEAGGGPAANLASWDGTALEEVGGGADGAVRALGEYRGELVVGGDFDAAGAGDASRLARWNGSAWRGFDESLIDAWTYVGTSPPIEYSLSVLDVAEVGGNLYVTGKDLYGSESVPTRGIIRWNEDEGAWAPLQNGLAGINALESGGDVLFVGGSFRTVAYGLPSVGIAAWREESRRPAGGRAAGSLRPTGAATALAALRAHPNPFRDETAFDFHLAAATDVRITIHDVQGRLVTEVLRGPRAPGLYTSRWNGRDRFGRRAAAGVYFVRLERGDDTITRKVLRLR